MTAPGASIKRLLRPMRRRINQWLGRDLAFRAEVHCPTVRLGSEYGGWVIQPGLIDRDSIVYSFGAGEDVSFDLAMIERFGTTVHVFDPTPKSTQWIGSQSLPSSFVFHPVGLADYDGTARFVLPRADYASYSMERGEGADTADCPVQRLATIMRDLHHTRIDLLKMDIESAEYAALKDIVASQVPIRQLLVEFHHTLGDRPSLEKTRTAVDMLRAANFRIFDVSPTGMEYSFIRQG